MKAGYGQNFVLACVASGLFSEMEKKSCETSRSGSTAVPLKCSLSRVVA